MSRNGVPVDLEGPLVTPPELWGIAVLFFGLGDLVTTFLGLQVAGVVELSPMVSVFGGATVYAVMLGLKAAVFALVYLLWRTVPSPHCLGAPLALAALGLCVTVWNLSILTRVAIA